MKNPGSIEMRCFFRGKESVSAGHSSCISVDGCYGMERNLQPLTWSLLEKTYFTLFLSRVRNLVRKLHFEGSGLYLLQPEQVHYGRFLSAIGGILGIQ